MPQQDQLFSNIFGGRGSGDLEQAVKDFPYFSAAQFYLLKQTSPGDPDYEKIAGRTALHFNNPFYLNYLLNKKQEAEDKVVEEAQAPIRENIIPPVAEPQTEKQEMLFEPLYTTDYFASQGIKLSEEVKADDKLGKQLRSFTDWLKTMKKVHEQKLPAGNAQLDLAVQNIAEKSNMEAEVVTESMAEVYISQGKPARAREIYQKLSLLDPSKSAFFAAKIESLKEN